MVVGVVAAVVGVVAVAAVVGVIVVAAVAVADDGRDGCLNFNYLLSSVNSLPGEVFKRPKNSTQQQKIIDITEKTRSKVKFDLARIS